MLAPPAARTLREREHAAEAAAELPTRSSAMELFTPSKRARPDGDQGTGTREASGGKALRALLPGAPRVLPTAQRGGGPYSEFGVYFEGELASSSCARAPWPARMQRCCSVGRCVEYARRARARALARACARVADAGEARARRRGPGLCVCVCREDPQAARERGWEAARGAGSGRGLMHHFPRRVRVGRRLHFALTRGNSDPHGTVRAPSATPAPHALKPARAEHAPQIQIDLLCVAGAARRTV